MAARWAIADFRAWLETLRKLRGLETMGPARRYCVRQALEAMRVF